MKPFGFNSHVLQQVFHEGEFSSCVVITFQVMAFTRMSPGDPYCIGTPA